MIGFSTHTSLSSTLKTPQFNTPLRQKIAEGCVELRGFWCGTEAYVEQRGFWCGTEGF